MLLITGSMEVAYNSSLVYEHDDEYVRDASDAPPTCADDEYFLR